MNDQASNDERVLPRDATHAADHRFLSRRHERNLMLDVLQDGIDPFQEGRDLAGAGASSLFRERKLLQFVHCGRVRDTGRTDGEHRIAAPDQTG
jgi:hypothetical protein